MKEAELNQGKIEFLLTEHKRFSEMLCRTEDNCGKRVDTFVKLLTAVVAALVALGTVSPEEQIFNLVVLTMLATTAMVGLCLFGMITFVAVILGQLAANRWRVRLDMITNVFKGKIPFKEYEPFKDSLIKKLVKLTFGDRVIGDSSRVVMAITIGLGAVAAGIIANWLQAPVALMILIVVLSGMLVGAFEYVIKDRLIKRSREVLLDRSTN